MYVMLQVLAQMLALSCLYLTYYNHFFVDLDTIMDHPDVKVGASVVYKLFLYVH